MGRIRGIALFFAAAFVFALSAWCAFKSEVYAGTLYKWTDDKGKLHVVSEAYLVPEQYRDNAQKSVTEYAPEPSPSNRKNADSGASSTPSEPAVKKSRHSFDSGWYSDASGYAEALRRQTSTGEAMLVYFYVDWCGYCKRFNSSVIPAPEAEPCLNKVLKVRINPEHGSGEDRLAGEYGVGGYPSIFIVGKKGQTRKKIHNVLDASAFAHACNIWM